MDIRLKILEDREKRIKLIQNKTSNSDNFFITVKSNICGENKNIKVTNILSPLYVNKIIQNFDVKNIEKIESYDGNYFLIEIQNTDFIKTKKTLINLENTNLGRFVDLDLYGKNEIKSISRKDLNLPSRKCIICEDEYINCIREKKHTKQQVITHTIKSVKSYFIDNLVDYAISSLKQEVMAHPKFGLVTKESNGKHKDMDYNTFLISIEAMKPYLYEFANEGFSFNDNTFNNVREIGKRAEINMLKATNGINTHKGAIFLFALLLPSIVNVIYNGEPFKNIQKNIKFLSRNILDDFKNLEYKSELTYGEKIYLKYGITGIRGVAKDGMDIAFNLTEKFLNDKSCKNILAINILINVMSKIDDTVILHNGTIQTVHYIKKEVNNIISVGGFNTQEGKKKTFNLTEECIKLNISPGGSADLVSIILTLIEVRKSYFWGV